MVDEFKKIDIKNKGKKIKALWNKCIGAGRANEGLRKAWIDQLETAVNECGFKYIRFHGLLCDDMGVYRVSDETENYCFVYVDQLFDELLKIGIKPFVEFGFMPDDMALGEGRQFWWKGNVSIPKDYNAWARLLTALVEHWIERYGMEEVLQWYFEIWNEPNLYPFWNGTKSQYFELYKYSVNAIKKIDKRLRVGGPATSNFVADERFFGENEDLSKHKTNYVEDINILEWKGVWIEDFIAFCTKEKLDIDFISTHPYPTDFALDGHKNELLESNRKGQSRNKDSVIQDLEWLNYIIKNSNYQRAEIQLTEWSSSPTSRDYSHDYLPVASYIIKTNLDCLGLADAISYWVFTDIFEEAGPGPELFHGGFGLVNMKGIKKPAYHAYRMLNELGDNMIAKTDSYIITKNEQGKLRGIVYYYPEEYKKSIEIAEYPNYKRAEEIQSIGKKKKISFAIEGLSANSKIKLALLDENHGNVTKLWSQMNYPKNATKEQENALKQYAEELYETEMKADKNGVFIFEESMKPWSVISICEE